MKKSTKIILIILLFVIAGISIQLYLYNKIDDVLIYKNVISQSKDVQKSYKNYQPIRCEFGLFNPKYAFVSYLHYFYPEDDVDMESWNIGFYHLSRPHFFSTNWRIKYTGGTTIRNTTFPELVAMVKEDCSQFQNGGKKGDIEWRYSKAPTEEEKYKDNIDFVERAFYQLEDNVKEVFIEKYGDVNKMSDEDKIAVYNEVQEKGWDLEFDKIRVITEARMDLSQLPEDQKRKIINTYGNWKNLNDDEFFEWKAVIDKDYESGKFSLD